MVLAYEWDEDKRRANLVKHGIDFTAMGSFEWDTAVEAFDDRHNEPRWAAIGYIDRQLHVVVYTVRHDTIRVISLRKATPRERGRYAET